MKHPCIIDCNGKAYGKTGTKNLIISRLIKTPQGRARLAAAMVQPIRRSLNYYDIGRKAFNIQQLPQGALPVYDKDIDVVKGHNRKTTTYLKLNDGSLEIMADITKNGHIVNVILNGNTLPQKTLANYIAEIDKFSNIKAFL